MYEDDLSPAEIAGIRKTEGLLSELIFRKAHGIPLTARGNFYATRHTRALAKAIASSNERSRLEFARLNSQLATMAKNAERQRLEEERTVLAKALGDTQRLIDENPDKRPAAYLAAIQVKLDALAAKAGVGK